MPHGPVHKHPTRRYEFVNTATLHVDHHEQLSTRKLSYRKDDRAMRPMYGCPEHFRESLTTQMATFVKIRAALFKVL